MKKFFKNTVLVLAVLTIILLPFSMLDYSNSVIYAGMVTENSPSIRTIASNQEGKVGVSFSNLPLRNSNHNITLFFTADNQSSSYFSGLTNTAYIGIESINGKTSGTVNLYMPVAIGNYEIISYVGSPFAMTERTGTSYGYYVDLGQAVFRNVPQTVSPEEALNITVENMPSSSKTWVGIFPYGARSFESKKYARATGGSSTIGINTASPQEPGEYCIKVISYNPDNECISVSTSSYFRVLSSESDNEISGSIPLPDGWVFPTNGSNQTATPTSTVTQKPIVTPTPTSTQTPAVDINTNLQTSGITLMAQAGKGYVNLNWKNGMDLKGVKGYHIYKSEIAGGQKNMPETDFYVTGNTYTDTKVQSGTKYFYIVKPIFTDNSVGKSSNEVSATPKDGAGVIELSISNPKMIVNGSTQEIDPGKGTFPVIKEGRTFLPIRALIENMGGNIVWDGKQGKVAINWNDKTVEIWIGKKDIKVNGVSKTMDVAPYISSTGRTMLPLRFVTENLGCVITWDGDTKSAVIIYDKDNSGETDAYMKNQTAVSATPTPVSATLLPATPVPVETTVPTSTTATTQKEELSWTGVWDTDYGPMILTQTGKSVSGTYETEDFKINGTISGNTLSGTFDENGESGSFELKIFENGTFNGRHRYDSDEDWSDWSGTRMSENFGSTGTAWGGVWYTDYGPMIINQNGSSFTGIYQGAYKYKIEGTVSGTMVKGRIDEGSSKGDFEFNLYSDGKSYTGKFRYDGEDEWIDWTGTKKK